jgi:hypothetical protein
MTSLGSVKYTRELWSVECAYICQNIDRFRRRAAGSKYIAARALSDRHDRTNDRFTLEAAAQVAPGRRADVGREVPVVPARQQPFAKIAMTCRSRALPLPSACRPCRCDNFPYRIGSIFCRNGSDVNRSASIPRISPSVICLGQILFISVKHLRTTGVARDAK